MNKTGNNVQKTSSPSVLLVGLEDEKEKMKEKLTRGPKDLDVVSIVGTGGIGKTTMARNLYQELGNRFHVQAFCCVSQSYDKKRLLLDILPQVSKLPGNAKHLSYEELSDILYKGLKGRRYLVVMDDLWDIGAWNGLRSCFPNDHNHSRILFTSRQTGVVSQVKHENLPHCLRFLNEQESWKLLEKKAFHQGGCPPDLLDVGRKIAKRCKGLPLAIVVVAGILASTEPDRDKWEQIAESGSTDLEIECSHIFELSYNYLPPRLKQCFLYLAAFEEDAQIPTRKLIQFWIAEGFISGREDKCSEDLAEICLKDLVGRNLVMVSERRSDGGIKKCHLHDLMLDFCLRKAQEEKFMQRLHGYNLSAFQSLDASNPRLCSYYTGFFQNLSKFLFNPHLSSLLFFRGTNLSHLMDYSSICSLKHLTMLDLAGLGVTEHFFNMELPAQLRYLAVCGAIYDIPPSISQLSKLETLVVTTHVSKAIRLPHSIWKMEMLRHLHVDGGSFFKLPEPRGKLKNLQSLCIVCYHACDAEKILKAVTGLRKLKCSYLNSHRLSLHLLSQLESLHLDRSGWIWEGFDVCGLNSNLKKLTISNIRLREFDIPIPLHSLEVLKILSAQFEEQNWCMKQGGKFLKLKFLKLRETNIKLWDASRYHFPCLEKLVVHKCEELESIPSSFGEIPSLQCIDVQWCAHSVASSVRQIQEDQMNIGNEELKVHIYPQD